MRLRGVRLDLLGLPSDHLRQTRVRYLQLGNQHRQPR